jgi:hypothetical protein
VAPAVLLLMLFMLNYVDAPAGNCRRPVPLDLGEGRPAERSQRLSSALLQLLQALEGHEVSCRFATSLQAAGLPRPVAGGCVAWAAVQGTLPQRVDVQAHCCQLPGACRRVCKHVLGHVMHSTGHGHLQGAQLAPSAHLR